MRSPAAIIALLVGACSIGPTEIPSSSEPGRSDLSRVVRWQAKSDNERLRFEGLGATGDLEFSLTLHNVVGADGAWQSAFDVYDVGVGAGTLILDADGAIVESSLPEGDAFTGDLFALAMDTHASIEAGSGVSEYPAASARLCLPNALRKVLPATCGELYRHNTGALLAVIGGYAGIQIGVVLDWNPGGWIITLASSLVALGGAAYWIVTTVKYIYEDCGGRWLDTWIHWPYCDP